MENYPSNAKNPNRERANDSPAPPKMAKVVTSPVTRQKKSLGRRFKETFIGGSDAQSVWSYVLFDVLIPAGRDMMFDAVTQGVERTLYGEARPGVAKRGTGFGSINYNRISQPHQSHQSRLVQPPSRDPRPAISRVARSQYDFSDFVIATRAEAEDVLARLTYALDRYGQVSVGDLYDALDITGEYTDENWGWTNLHDARVSRARRGGYLLSLPQPEPLS